MPYAEKEDYSLSISSTELNEILDEASNGYDITSEAVRLKCEKKAEDKIINYLGSKYDLATEFAQTGLDRNFELLGVYIDLTLCAVFKSVSPDDIPEMRDEACQMAVKNLEMWRDGDKDLDGVDEIEDPVGRISTIMPTKFISKPYSDPLLMDDN